MIDTSNWKDFRIGDLFDAYLSKDDIQPKNITKGDTPLISSGKTNNGIVEYIDDDKAKKWDANTITVDMFGKAFYQNSPYHCVSHGRVNILVSKFDLTENIGLFLCSVIEQVSVKYQFDNMCTGEKLSNDVIKLPATSDGQPDWDYMESYMKAVIEESEKSLGNLKKADGTKHLINVSRWGEFRVGDLFEKLDLKCHKKFDKATDVSTEQTEEFDLPLVNAKHGNNGIMYYGRSEDWDSTEMTIDIVGDGAASTGDVYAQPQRTGVLYNAYLVKPLWDCTSEYVLQFMACVIERCIKSHFGYENKCTWDKVSQESVWLPITSTGEPDWQYMENYMKGQFEKSELVIKELQSRI